mmetsp:Transcript_45048/g.105300  ORF Transcript_45048/g.105300 Transcript_45048/m.105300 type:complete len:82 (+) Transcript_45048:151-396(+)
MAFGSPAGLWGDSRDTREGLEGKMGAFAARPSLATTLPLSLCLRLDLPNKLQIASKISLSSEPVEKGWWVFSLDHSRIRSI